MQEESAVRDLLGCDSNFNFESCELVSRVGEAPPVHGHIGSGDGSSQGDIAGADLVLVGDPREMGII